MSSRYQKFLVSHLLMLLTFIGPMLSFWTTPLITQSVQGEQILVCTYQGIKKATLTPQGEIVVQQDTDSCPVLQLQVMLGSALLSTVSIPKLHATHSHPLSALAYIEPSARVLYSYSVRAPPVA